MSVSRGGQILAFGGLFPEVTGPISFLPPLIFEHVAEELLHWSIPDGLAEKEELHAF